MTIDAALWGEDMLTGRRVAATQGRLVFVAVDELGRPTPVDRRDGDDDFPIGTWTVERVQPSQTNDNGRILGGELMRLIDTVAFIAATRHARTPLVTASISAMGLDLPLIVGDLFIVTADVIKVGHRSLVVSTDLRLSGGRHIASAELAMVRP